MSKGKKRQAPPGGGVPVAADDNWVSPFRDLKIDVPPPSPPPPPPPPPPPSREDILKQKLSRQDLELLKAFGGDGQALTVGTGAPLETDAATPNRKGLQLTLAVERKGRGDKTVTVVRGLQAIGTAAQMELCAEIKTGLGIGARFADAVLELQGDQRQRAAAWLEKRRFSCRILP